MLTKAHVSANKLLVKMGAGRALVISGAVGVGIYLGLGFPGWLAGAIGVLGFLGLGGWPITRVAYNTLPRDLG